MKQTVLVNEKDSLVIHFNELEDWDSFETILEILCKYFSAQILKRVDGPESKIVAITIEGNDMELVNNPYGNYLRASSDSAKNILRLVNDDWTKYSHL